MKTRASGLSAAVVAVACLAFGAPAWSQQNDMGMQPYGGVSVGGSKWHDRCNGISDCDDATFGFKAFGGIDVNRYLAAELGYVYLGETSSSFEDEEFNSKVDDDFETSSFFVALIGQFPLHESGAIFAKIGYHSWSQDYKYKEKDLGTGAEILGKSELDGSDPFFGLGYRHFLGENLGVRLEWERFTLDAERFGVDLGRDIDFFSAGVEYRF